MRHYHNNNCGVVFQHYILILVQSSTCMYMYVLDVSLVCVMYSCLPTPVVESVCDYVSVPFLTHVTHNHCALWLVVQSVHCYVLFHS